MPTVPDWLKEPWYKSWAPDRADQYARWSTAKTWPWYAPQAQLEDKPWATVVNRLLPYMSPADVPTVARQLFTAGGGGAGPFKTYGQAPQPTPSMRVPSPPESGGYGDTLQAIRGVLANIPNPTARDWARMVFEVYEDLTRWRGIRGSRDESLLQAQLEDMFATVPEEAEPYAAALQRLVQPTVTNPAREWYEMPAYMRTSPTSWRALGYEFNPAWR